MDDLNESINIVGAHAAALSGLHPIQYNPYEPTTLSAAVGTYRDEYAVAVGVFHYVRENVLFGIMKRESKFDAEAVSDRGAVGLMQLMPPTAREAARRLGEETFSPLVPEQNIMLGAAHFAYLRAKFGRRLPLAVAAYNAGAAAVSRWGADEASDWVEWIEDIPYPQTREYVRSVLENIEIYDFGGAAVAHGRRSFFAWAGLPPSLGGEFAEKQKNSAQME